MVSFAVFGIIFNAYLVTSTSALTKTKLMARKADTSIMVKQNIKGLLLSKQVCSCNFNGLEVNNAAGSTSLTELVVHGDASSCTDPKIIFSTTDDIPGKVNSISLGGLTQVADTQYIATLTVSPIGPSDAILMQDIEMSVLVDGVDNGTKISINRCLNSKKSFSGDITHEVSLLGAVVTDIAPAPQIRNIDLTLLPDTYTQVIFNSLCETTSTTGSVNSSMVFTDYNGDEILRTSICLVAQLTPNDRNVSGSSNAFPMPAGTKIISLIQQYSDETAAPGTFQRSGRIDVILTR